ncbi:MAG: biotin--[acetyl-CoA-carboxylase] ligase [Chloroflexota bacterium]|nr:biotin--[acetyl-CoA-carboxylase] ligase [Chloroflexota bacterium]
MSDVASLAEAGATAGLVVVAGAQTAGQGRAGRTWIAPAWTSLLCSALLKPALPSSALATLSLIVGLAAAEAIEARIPVRIKLKWPNDLWLGDSKLGGVLVKARSCGDSETTIIVGIGINLGGSVEALPPGAISISAAGYTAPSIAEVLASLLDRLEVHYRKWSECEGRVDLDNWRSRAALLGNEVTVEESGSILTGRFLDVADDGALILGCGDGPPRRIVAGDLIRGPRLRSG